MSNGGQTAHLTVNSITLERNPLNLATESVRIKNNSGNVKVLGNYNFNLKVYETKIF